MDLAQALPPLADAEGRKLLWDYLVRQRAAGAYAEGPEMLFLGFCLVRYPSSWAQNFQDLYVVWKLRQKSGGYFVEFGAMDGLAISNTALLEQAFGWQGVLSEPNPVWHARLRQNRKATVDTRCVWRETGAQLQFSATTKAEFSTIAGYPLPASQVGASTSIPVETVSLRDLLEQHRAPEIIDYLSIDTEGSELEILRAFDFRRRFRIITVEHNFNEQLRHELFRLLNARGYAREFEDFSRWDDWYFDPSLVP